MPSEIGLKRLQKVHITNSYNPSSPPDRPQDHEMCRATHEETLLRTLFLVRSRVCRIRDLVLLHLCTIFHHRSPVTLTFVLYLSSVLRSTLYDGYYINQGHPYGKPAFGNSRCAGVWLGLRWKAAQLLVFTTTYGTAQNPTTCSKKLLARWLAGSERLRFPTLDYFTVT